MISSPSSFGRPVRFALIASLLTLAACGAGSSPTGTPAPTPSDPTPGWLTLQLATPNGNDGAVQFVVTGPAIDTVKVPDFNGYADAGGTIANIIVTGQVGNGTIGRIFVPDLARSSEYQASVVAAAVRGTYQLQNLTGYHAMLVR